MRERVVRRVLVDGLVITSEARTRALELLVGRAHVALPVTIIARVMVVQYARLPLAHRLVVGLGFDDKRAIVCVSLTPARTQSDSTKAVVFDTAGRIAFGLCIDEALDLVDVVRVERGATHANLPAWVRRARTADGRTLGWIDADVLIAELSDREVRA